MIDANQLLTLSLIEGCRKHELFRHVASLPAAVRNREAFGFMSVQVVTGAEMLMMSFFRPVQFSLSICTVSSIVRRRGWRQDF